MNAGITKEQWYTTAEYVLTDNIGHLNQQQVDTMLAEVTYSLSEEEAENFLSTLGNLAKKALPVLQSAAPAIGTVLGGVVGGPIGASLGGALGKAVGGIGRTPSNPNPSTQGSTSPQGQPNQTNIASPQGSINGTANMNIGVGTSLGGSNHAPVANQLLLMVNNPQYLVQILRAVMDKNPVATTRPTEELADYTDHLSHLSNSLRQEHYFDMPITNNDEYNETHCEECLL